MKNRILLVEDDDSIREATALVLRDEGYQVDEVNNGEEALIYLKRTRTEPCLVLLDLFMPKLNGLELIKIMQKTDQIISVPVVIMSAGSKFKPPEGIPFIKKPFDLDLLIKIVNGLCS